MRKQTLAFAFLIFSCVSSWSSINYNLYQLPQSLSHLKLLPQTASPWFKDAVFYELFVREFYDSNGDGYGDFLGIIEKLDYLEELGVNAIWLLPINTNTDGDHCYSVSDYYGITQDYGTKEDFISLIEACKARNIRIVLDKVINHSSSLHPFFIEASNKKDSSFRDWYIFSDKKIYDSQPWSNQSVWHETSRDDFYYGIFSSHMPDFNFHNKEVYHYFLEVFDYWLKMGVAGFRIDAASHIFENGKKQLADQQETFDFFKGIRHFANHYQDVFLIGEATLPEYIGNGNNSLNGYFNFGLVGALSKTFYHKDAEIFMKEFQQSYEAVPKGGSIGNVLNNHDSFLGPRVASRFKNQQPLLKIAATLLLTLPGIPFIYYGEEIGMNSNSSYGGDWALRTPMQWDAGHNAGFSTIKKLKPRKPPRSYKKINVAQSLQDKDSLLKHYQQMIALRKEFPAFRSDALQLYYISKNHIIYTNEDANSLVGVIINTSSKKITLQLPKVLQNSRIIWGHSKTQKINDTITTKPHEIILMTNEKN